MAAVTSETPELSRFGDFMRAQEVLRAECARPESLVQAIMGESAERTPWRELPTFAKQTLIDDQRRSPPFGRRLRVSPEDLALIVESSGTAYSEPEVHYLSQHDLERVTDAMSSANQRLGITADDVVGLTLPVGMAGGGIKMFFALAAIGCKVLRLGNLSTEDKIEAIRRYGASVLVATPAYVDRCAHVAQSMGIDPASLPIERLLVATQSVSTPWVLRAQDVWAAKAFEWYGTSAGAAAFSCAEGMLSGDGQRGTLHWDPSFQLLEVVHPDGEWVEHDEVGELIVTPLAVEAEGLVRLSTGDAARYVAPGSCPCGLPFPGLRSGTIHRTDRAFNVKGVNLDPAVIDRTLLFSDDVLDYSARLFVDDQGRERVSVRVWSPVRDAARSGLRELLERTMHELSGLHIEVEIRDPQGMAQERQLRGEGIRHAQWVDERPHIGFDAVAEVTRNVGQPEASDR